VAFKFEKFNCKGKREKALATCQKEGIVEEELLYSREGACKV
jgi:hypothetical protein